MSDSTKSPAASRKSLSGHYILGIDVGTTSVKVCLVNVETREVSHKFVKDTLAAVAKDVPPADLQDASKLFSALHGCVSRIPHDFLARVVRIAICGQMHGIMFWKHGQGWHWHPEHQGSKHQHWEVSKQVSPVYTWQDARCSETFLRNDIPDPDSHLRLATGYGCTTLFWLWKNQDPVLQDKDRCGTIMDYIVNLLTENQTVKTSEQLAASWGYFNTTKNEWNRDILNSAGFPTQMLPEVLSAETTAGVLAHPWFDIPQGTPIGVALGDLQCSVRSTLIEPNTDAVLNVSTSAQMAFVKKAPFEPPTQVGTTYEYFPYFGGTYVAVAASLNGGNCLAAFVKMLQSWTVDLGLSINQSKIWEKTIECGQNTDHSDGALMRIQPLLFGERHDPTLQGSVDSIHLDNMSLGQVTRGICHGIAKNLADMMSPQMLQDAGIQRIVGSGACLTRNPVLKAEFQDVYQMPVEFLEEGSACIGAALAALDVNFTS